MAWVIVQILRFLHFLLSMSLMGREALSWTRSSCCRLWKGWSSPAAAPPCSWSGHRPIRAGPRRLVGQPGRMGWSRERAPPPGTAGIRRVHRWSHPRRYGRTPRRGPPTAWARWAGGSTAAGWKARWADPPGSPVGPSYGWCGCSGRRSLCRAGPGTSGAGTAL